MPLTLITGPANAAKAGAVLERLRAALPRHPALVVPTAADAAHYARELAGAGIVFGAQVTTFPGLIRDIARVAGSTAPSRRLGRLARRQVIRAAVGDVALHALRGSASAPGFADALADLFAELQVSLVSSGRFATAVRAWTAAPATAPGGGGMAPDASDARSPAQVGSGGAGMAPDASDVRSPARVGSGAGGTASDAWGARSPAPAHAGELAALYGAYHRRLEALGAVDGDGFALAALDALRVRPAAWGERPLFLYGFDELTPAQLDLVETLVRRTATPVCVALPYEPGRAALAGSAATVELLKPLAGEHVVLDPRAEHYADSARGALHHLERGLFEPLPARRPPNGAVRLLEAGGERAEAELVGASVLELLRDGMAPDDVAVLVRGELSADLFAQVLDGYGIPVSRERTTAFARTRLGAGLLAFARAALPGGTAQHVVTWLRTPGKVDPDMADRLEVAVRRGQARTATEARRLCERLTGDTGSAHRNGSADVAAASDDPAAPAVVAAAAGFGAPTGSGAQGEPRSPHEVTARAGLSALDELAAAAGGGAEAFLGALLAEAETIWTAPHVRRADVLSPEAEADARAGAALRTAAGELVRLAAVDPALAAGPAELLEALAAVEVRDGAAAADGVLLADPLAIRARRFRAVFVCGLQEGELPRRPLPEPFLDDSSRAALAVASGLVLPRHEDALARERSLFYACVSRPEEALFLSFRTSDEEGDPQQPSPFVDDVRALFTDELWTGRGRRLLAEVTWPPAEAPTPHELRCARAAAESRPDPPPLAAPATPGVLAALAARDRESSRGLETFAGCPVRWLVEHVLRPGPVDPDPEPMQRGSRGHAVLELTLRRLKARTGSARLTPETLPDALAELQAAVERIAAPGPGARARAAARALQVDLERYLRHETACGAGYEPALLEWGFGGDHDAAAALDVAGVAVSGRVDRIDVDASSGPASGGPSLAGRRAVVRDYKGRTVAAGARWVEDGKVQAALYALAVRERLGLDVAGALYQPIGRADQRPRGVVRDDVAGRYVNGDVMDAETLEKTLAQARDVAARAAGELRAGRVRPCPERCSFNGTCAHPGICRA